MHVGSDMVRMLPLDHLLPGCMFVSIGCASDGCDHNIGHTIYSWKAANNIKHLSPISGAVHLDVAL